MIRKVDHAYYPGGVPVCLLKTTLKALADA